MYLFESSSLPILRLFNCFTSINVNVEPIFIEKVNPEKGIGRLRARNASVCRKLPELISNKRTKRIH